MGKSKSLPDDEEYGGWSPPPPLRRLLPKHIKRFDAIGDTNEPASEILWVYHHRDDDPPNPMLCPSRGAWSMLELARSKPPEWFMEKMYRPICGEMAKKKTDMAEAGLTKREKYCRGEIEKMLMAAVAESQV